MKRFKPLFAALICALSATFVSCDFFESALENSIYNTWSSYEEYGSTTIYYTYKFSATGTYTYTEETVYGDGSSYTTDSEWGDFTFSNIKNELVLYIYGGDIGESRDAYISDGVLYISEYYASDGRWRYTQYDKQ